MHYLTIIFIYISYMNKFLTLKTKKEIEKFIRIESEAL